MTFWKSYAVGKERKGVIGTEGKLPLLASENKKKSSYQNTACENTWTVDNVHNPVIS
jgi:hypothetical protein